MLILEVSQILGRSERVVEPANIQSSACLKPVVPSCYHNLTKLSHVNESVSPAPLRAQSTYRQEVRLP